MAPSRRLVLFLSLLVGVFGSGLAKLGFLPMRHELRLHYNAPPELLVATVRAVDPDQPDIAITYALHEVHDHKYFRLDRESGHLYTDTHVHVRLGKTLSVMVVAMGNEQFVFETFRIRIVEYNRFTPTFDYDVYRTEVSYALPVNSTLLRVQAHDNDSMPYNAELYYTLLPSNSSDSFLVDLQTGEVRLGRKLEPEIRQIVLPVLVEDGGSPVRSSTTSIEIAVKTISAPRDIRDRNPTGNTLEVCWDRPSFGFVVGYLIRFRESGPGQDGVREVNVTKENVTFDGAGFCAELHGLKPWTDYEYRVYAWNRDEIGLGSEVTTSSTRSNYCLRQPCQRGRCIPISGDPGFLCDCDRGYYGSTCNLFNACVLRPCGEFGTCHNTSDHAYHCVCVEGFSGDNCSVFDPCSIRTSPCSNGAACHSSAPGKFRCDCAHGFYGKTCNKFNPCLSAPCFHGATCYNVSDVEYKCLCVPGFQGKHCEVNIDECVSNPCANRGTCVDDVNQFHCLCPPGYTGDFCNEIDYCPEETTWVEHGAFHWPQSGFGDKVEVPCPAGPFDRQRGTDTAYATRTCSVSDRRRVTWSKVNSSKCKEEGFQMAERVAVELEGLTSDVTNMSTVQFEATTKQIENVVAYAVYDRKIAHSMLSVISNMLDVGNQVLVNNESSTTTGRLVDVVKKYTSSVIIDRGESVSFQTDNLALKAINWDPEAADVYGRGLTFESSLSNRQRRSPYDSDEDNSTNEMVPSITIPLEALEMAQAQSANEVRVQFVAFKNAKFFRERNSSESRTAEDTNQRVLIASISNVSVVNLTRPVVYEMQITSADQPYVCAYWREAEKEWAYDGLVTNQSGNVVFCESSHMTAFSVLLDPDPHAHVTKEHRAALSIISYVGCALSIIGLVLTIVTYSLFRCLNRDRSGKILLNLCVAMLLMNVAFLGGSQSQGLHHVNVCIAVAITTHYFLLATLSWMCVEAINMYQMLIYVFASSETRFMLKRCIAAWGIPVVIVAVTAGIDVGHYYNKNEYCMLSSANPYVYYLSFLGPSCLILLINCIVFIMVTRVLFQPRVTGKVGSDAASRNQVTLAQVRGAFTVMTLLGITWVFGALAIGPTKLAFQYIFCILNSLQGFLIFFVRCVQYPEARSAWLQLARTRTRKKYRGTAVSHSHSNGGGKSSHAHSQTSRTASGDTSSSAYVNSTGTKERRISASSLANFFRTASKKKNSIDEDDTKPGEPDKSKEDGAEDSLSQLGSSAKEGRDTQWEYYCCTMKRHPCDESKAVTSAPLLGSVNADDLPFIEDEQRVAADCPESTSQSDLGYSSAENSPNASRILQEPPVTQEPLPEMDTMADCPLADSQHRKRILHPPRHVSRHCGRVYMTPTLEPILSATNSPVHDLTQMASSLSDIKGALERLVGTQQRPLHDSYSKSLGSLDESTLLWQRVGGSGIGLPPPSGINSCQELSNHGSGYPWNRRTASDPQVMVPLCVVEAPSNESVPSASSATEGTRTLSSRDSLERLPRLRTPLEELRRKYNDSFVVSSIEDISYMDASSVEGDNAILCSI